MTMNKKKIIYNGIEYDSMKAMCNDIGVSYTLVNNRMRNGWTLEDAINTPKHYRPVVDHLGNEYRNLAEMADVYNIKAETLSSRLNNDWGVEKALTTPVKRVVYANTPWVDLDGNHYRTLISLCYEYGYPSFYSVMSFIRRGYTREEIFSGFKNVRNNKSLAEEVKNRGIIGPNGVTYSNLRTLLKDCYGFINHYQLQDICMMLFIGHTLKEAVDYAREREAKRNGGI